MCNDISKHKCGILFETPFPQHRNMSARFIATLALCTALFVCTASAFSTGAPAEVCVSLTPDHHGVKSQTVPAPYTIYIEENVKSAKAGDVLTVSIVGHSGNDTIKGFLLEARSAAAGSTEAIGEWRLQADNPSGQTRDCGKNPKVRVSALRCVCVFALYSMNNIVCPQSAVTHKKLDRAPDVVGFKWVAPKFSGPVEFIATVAHEWNVFWVGVKSEKIQITA